MKLQKIMTKETFEEQEKKRKRIMTLIIVFILMASTAAFAFTFSNNSEIVKYKDFKFIRAEKGWQLKDSSLVTTYLPSDVENISSESFDINDFKKKTYLIAITSTEKTAANEIANAFWNVFQNMQLACSRSDENESFCSDLPIKECSDNNEELIIQIEEMENQSFEKKDNCIIIRGNEEYLIKSSDMIIFSAYKVI